MDLEYECMEAMTEVNKLEGKIKEAKKKGLNSENDIKILEKEIKLATDKLELKNKQLKKVNDIDIITIMLEYSKLLIEKDDNSEKLYKIFDTNKMNSPFINIYSFR